ncbi:unnamed protein product, partial [Prorocentrum cordatum]
RLQDAAGSPRAAQKFQEEPGRLGEGADELARPKKKAKTERVVMALEDRLSAAARRQEAMALEVADWKARALQAHAAVEELEGRVRKFAEVASKIKVGSARKLERRDAIVAGLEAQLAQRQAQLSAAAALRARDLATVQCLQHRLLGVHSTLVTDIGGAPLGARAPEEEEEEAGDEERREALPPPSRPALRRRGQGAGRENGAGGGRSVSFHAE